MKSYAKPATKTAAMPFMVAIAMKKSVAKTPAMKKPAAKKSATKKR